MSKIFTADMEAHLNDEAWIARADKSSATSEFGFKRCHDMKAVFPIRFTSPLVIPQQVNKYRAIPCKNKSN